MSFRRVVAPTRLRSTGGEIVEAVLGAVDGDRVWLGLREGEALRLRDRAAAGGRLEWESGSAEDGLWLPVVELRLGPGYGGGANAVRAVVLRLREPASPPVDARPMVLVVDHRREIPSLREAAAAAGLEIVAADDLEDGDAVGVLLVGSPGRAAEPEPVGSLASRFSMLRVLAVASGAAASSEWADLLDSRRVFFVGGDRPKSMLLRGLLSGAAEDAWLRRVWRDLCPREDTEDGAPAFAWYDADRVSRRRAARRVLGDLGAQVERRLAGARARVLALDEWAEGLVGARPVEEGDWVDSPVAGLTALAVRAGVSIREGRAEESPFYDADLDAIPGCGSELVAAPVRDLSGTVLGVVAVSPLAEEGGLGPKALREVERLAAGFAVRLAALRDEGSENEDEGVDRTLFREEAIADQRRSEMPSAILNVSERWGWWIVGGLALFLVAVGLFLTFGKASEYAEGVAVVRGRNRVPVVATAGGTVAAVRLAPGAEVAAGDIIGTLYDVVELAEVERLEHEYEEALVRVLRNPEDPGAGAGLAALRGASEAARAALDQRRLMAPAGGALADLRVRVGTLVSPGQTVATIHAAGGGFEIVAAVPGNFRPLLRAGLPVVAELEQFPGSRFQLEASLVNPEVVGPDEARALVGPLLVPSGEGAGPVALVHAELPEVLVSSTGEEFPLYDGMRGRVRIPVREQRFIVTLWPALGRAE